MLLPTVAVLAEQSARLPVCSLTYLTYSEWTYNGPISSLNQCDEARKERGGN